jgi:hypothetical protein
MMYRKIYMFDRKTNLNRLLVPIDHKRTYELRQIAKCIKPPSHYEYTIPKHLDLFPYLPT